MAIRICYPFLYNLVFAFLVPFSFSLPLSSVQQSETPPEASSVLIPPIIKYWALPSAVAQHNITVKDDFGRLWYCTTYRQSHCVPLFTVSVDFKATTVPIAKPQPTNGKVEPNESTVPLNTGVKETNKATKVPIANPQPTNGQVDPNESTVTLNTGIEERNNKLSQQTRKNKQGKSLHQTNFSGPKTIVDVLPAHSSSLPNISPSFPPRSPTEKKNEKPFTKTQEQIKNHPKPADSVNRIKLTTTNEEDDLQYITVYYKHDEEQNASKEIHRKLETIINDTNADLINILQSYGFTGDPYYFEVPTTPIPYIEDRHINLDSQVDSSPSRFQNEKRGPESDADIKSDSSLIVQGEVLKIPLNDLSKEEDTPDSSQVSFQIFTYNKTENFLETHSGEQTIQIQMDKMHDTELDHPHNRNKVIFKSRFLPRRFNEAPKAGMIDTKVFIPPFRDSCFV